MQMTFEQAMRPGLLQAFATGRGSGYMMRSEKRGSSYGGPNRRPPRRKKAGFWYIFFTLLISIILWPVGMVMLWRRKVRFQAGTKLLISLLTLCLSVFLIVFALTVPLDNPQLTAYQDKANDWLDKAAVSAAAAGDATMKKAAETWNVMSDFADASNEYSSLQTADALDAGVALAGQARSAIEGLIHREPAATEAPADTEAPATDAPADTDVPATEVPADTGAPATEVPADTELPATEAPEGSDAPDVGDDAPTAIAILLPDATPDAETAQPLEAGALHANGEFEPSETEDATEEPTEAPVEEPTEEPAVDVTEEPAVEVTEAPTAEPTEAPTEVPTEEPTEVPTEEPTAQPTPEPTPVPDDYYFVKPASEATVYYYVSGSKGFHISPTRHGMDGAPAHTLAEAFADGKSPCQSCGMPDESVLQIEHIAWVDEDNLIHTTEDCDSFAGHWRLMSLEDALDAGYDTCADCRANLYAEDVRPTPTPTPEPTATPEPQVVAPETPLKSAGELTVYYFDASKGYHVAPNCVGMSNAPAHTLSQALTAGKHACGNCFPPSTDLIGLPVLWLDEAGLCHTSDECAGFTGQYKLIERDDALEQGLTPCPDCGAADYLIPGTVLAK